MAGGKIESPSTHVSLFSRLRGEGDQAAWAEFHQRYHDLLLRFCRRRGLQHADAEDVVQNVLVGLSKSIRNFIYDPQRGRFRDYLYRCVRNALCEWARRTMRPAAALDSLGESALPATDETESRQAWRTEWIAHHYRLALETIRAEFDPRNLVIFERNIAGESIEALAVSCGVSEQSIYSARRRIRERLREVIARQVREEDEPDGPPAEPAPAQ